MANFQTTEVQIADLAPHPRNYRAHPTDQIEHLRASIRTFGVYRNVVVASDGVILAGHGVVEAAKAEGLDTIPVYQLNLPSTDPNALKLLASDNELGRFAEDDDRLLTNLLKELSESEVGLEGTGYDEAQLAALVLVTRPESEIADFDAAAEWAGMPDMGEAERQTRVQLIVWCDTIDERNQALNILGAEIVGGNRNTVSVHWPIKEREVREDSSLQYVGEK